MYGSVNPAATNTDFSWVGLSADPLVPVVRPPDTDRFAGAELATHLSPSFLHCAFR